MTWDLSPPPPQSHIISLWVKMDPGWYDDYPAGGVIYTPGGTFDHMVGPGQVLSLPTNSWGGSFTINMVNTTYSPADVEPPEPIEGRLSKGGSAGLYPTLYFKAYKWW